MVRRYSPEEVGVDYWKVLPQGKRISPKFSSTTTVTNSSIIGGDPLFGNCFGKLRKTIADFDRTYTINIDNTNAFDVQITLLGANQFVIPTAIPPFPAGVTVTVSESSYNELLFETINRPFIVGGMEFNSNNINQLQQIPFVRKRTGTGLMCEEPFHLFSYFSAYQFNNFLEVYPMKLFVNGQKSINMTLLSLSTLQITIYVSKRADLSNILLDCPIEEVGSNVSDLFKGQEVSFRLPQGK